LLIVKRDCISSASPRLGFDGIASGAKPFLKSLANCPATKTQPPALTTGL
jgi:hypothetical protein